MGASVRSRHSIVKNGQNSGLELVVVLGMHRSGTSLISNILAQAGYFIGEKYDLIPGGSWNRDGYFERKSVVHANDGILALCEGSWISPPKEELVLNLGLNQTIAALLKTYDGHKRALIKDPRLCLTFPVWERVLPENIRIIMMKRRPDAVAASLASRFGVSPQTGRALWEVYTERAWRYAIRHSTYPLQYEDLFSEQRARVLVALAEFLEIKDDLEKIAQKVVDPSLRHHESAEHDFISNSKITPVFTSFQ